MKDKKNKRYQMGRGIRYVDFVKEWRACNPSYSWVEAMKYAAPDYHKIVGTPVGSGYATRTKVGPGYGRKKMRGGAGKDSKGLLASLLQGLNANVSIK